MEKLPRKIKKKVPKGMYCYTYKKPLFNENGTYGGYEVTPCPFYERRKLKDIPKQDEITKQFPDKSVGYCKFLKDKLSVDDQIKDCNINYSFKK